MSFQSAVAEQWVRRFLRHFEVIERFAHALPDETFGECLKTADGKDSRTVGDLLMDVGMQVCHATGKTVTIRPMFDAKIEKDEVMDMLRKGRTAIWTHATDLTDDDIARPRNTLSEGEGTYLDEIAGWIAKVNRTFGQALMIARLTGTQFNPERPDKYPLPYADGDDVPGLD
jgi:hypothetical protein